MRLEFSSVCKRYSGSRDLIATKVDRLEWEWRTSGINSNGAIFMGMLLLLSQDVAIVSVETFRLQYELIYLA